MSPASPSDLLQPGSGARHSSSAGGQQSSGRSNGSIYQRTNTNNSSYPTLERLGEPRNVPSNTKRPGGSMSNLIAAATGSGSTNSQLNTSMASGSKVPSSLHGVQIKTLPLPKLGLPTPWICLLYTSPSPRD